MHRRIALLMLLPGLAVADPVIRTTAGAQEDFPVSAEASESIIYFETRENILIQKAAGFLADDIERVTGRRTEIVTDPAQLHGNVIVVATTGSELVEKWVAAGHLDVDPIRGEWERFMIQTVEDPLPGVEQALVVVGSDRRGAAYGVFTLSEKMGVSPWYYWADVPVVQKENLYLEAGCYVSDGPVVKYRGIFINDEAPCLRNWATEQFGGLNHEFYEKVFELLLRNRANYLWPAMWLPNMFNVDDPLNAKTADAFGIVMATSHHEPMMRAHNEWYLHSEGTPWNYETNKDRLQEFWRGGIERMGSYESVVTVGMRGDGDEAMSEETAVGLLQEIIADQRKMIADVTGRPAEETPQVWAVYKEVQDYFDKGMRVDDDIIVLFCDDNWGNLRILPKQKDLDHPGGYGIYYHFDYVGGPRSYKWLNTTQIERVWEQMGLAYRYGVKDLWLVNVGDIKPMELPISFFLDYAWNPEAVQAADLPDYYVQWSNQQFGGKHAEEIAELLALYTKYNARRTPEMLSPETYSVENYREADRIVAEYAALLERSEKVREDLPEQFQSAYYQLVHYPIAACANLNGMMVAAGKNRYYRERGAASANFYADRVRELFEKDAELTRHFHEGIADGKWNHMMSQTHIGYTYWNHPPLDTMPPVSYVQVDQPAELGYLIEHGEKPPWGWLDVEADWFFGEALPEFDPVNDQDYYIDIINRGTEPLRYSVEPGEEWIRLSRSQGRTRWNEKVYVRIDWKKAPAGISIGEIKISGAGETHTVKVPIRNEHPGLAGYVENQGVVSFNASGYSRKIDAGPLHWSIVPNLGRTGSAMMMEPLNTVRQKLEDQPPCLEYDFSVSEPGGLTVRVHCSPTQDFRKNDGLWFAVGIDDEDPQLINLNAGESVPDWKHAEWWEQTVGDHIKIRTSNHVIHEAGQHTLKIHAMDPGVVFQKFIIDAGGLKPSYLGPPESVHAGRAAGARH